jgi:hypothetical protein
MEGVVIFLEGYPSCSTGEILTDTVQSNELLARLLRAELASLDMAACPGGPDCFAIEISAQCFSCFERSNGFKDD